ncbi:MAG: hypothetical protein ACKPE6_07685, partial [Gammaproteobacteria bacterium]
MARHVSFNGFTRIVRACLGSMALMLAAHHAHAALGSFTLIAPGTDGEPGGVVSDPATVESFTWTASSGAEKYTFYLSYPDGQFLEVPDLLPA